LKDRLILFGCIALSLILLDQWTKQLAIQHLKGHFPLIFWGNLFRLEYAENPGAFLGLGSNIPDGLRFFLMTGVVAIILLGCLYFVLKDPKLTKWPALGFALVISGGLSNLLDRLFRTEGRVVDFMNMGIGPLRTGIFNIADMAIMAGIGIIFFTLIREPKPKRAKVQTR
jgi:signal peptidase II